MNHRFNDVSNSEMRHIIDEYIHSERDRNLLVDRLINGYTYEKLGELYELSDVQVKRIIYKQSDTVSKHLGA